jgi:hypothetical protein
MRNILLLLIVSVCIIPINCSKKSTPPEKWERNPNLALLTKPHFPTEEEKGLWECCSPVWSPDGSKVFYIERRLAWWDPQGNKGNIWVIESSDENAHVIKEGDYLYLSMSPGGDKLAALIRSYKYSFPGGTLALVDLNNLSEDEVIAVDTEAFVLGVRFSSDGDNLIYYAYFEDEGPKQAGFYSHDLKDSTSSFLFPESWEDYRGFDVNGDWIVTLKRMRKLDGSESRELMIYGMWPSFRPDGQVFVSETGFGAYVNGGDEMHMIDAQADTLITYLDVRTHELSTASFPNWSPDGNRIVFASRPWYGDNFGGLLELWILNNVE